MSGRATRTRPRRHPGSPGRGELGVVVGAVVCVLAGLCWVSGGLTAVVGGDGWHEVAPAEMLGVLVRLGLHPSAPGRAFPSPMRRDLSEAAVFWGLFALLVLVLAAGSILVVTCARRRRRPRPRPRPRPREHRQEGWASRLEVAPLVVDRAGRGRLVVGRLGSALIATERGQSLLVVGPTQSGKTSGLAVPAILEWEGPVLATSVKTDLVQATAAPRRRVGRVVVFDPFELSGVAGACWSPLGEARSWLGARRVAAGLCSAQREGGRAPEDAGFWGTLAEKLLAPMLLAAATAGGSIGDVVRWLDSREVDEVLDSLEAAGAEEAMLAAQASFSREERQLSSVYATAEAAVAAFSDPAVLAAASGHDIEPQALLDGGHHTCLLVAPADDQERLRPVFVAILRCVLEAAFARAARRGPLEPPLLVVLDEAANIASPSNLDALASTCSSHGVDLVTIWHDFAQIEARYGQRAATVVNNHRAKLVCPGVSDPSTLELVSRLIGDRPYEAETVTVDRDGVSTTTRSAAERRLAPAAQLRTLEPGEAVLVYGHLAPIRLRLRSVCEDRGLRRNRLGRWGRARTDRRQGSKTFHANVD